jgi:hypothetical protein
MILIFIFTRIYKGSTAADTVRPTLAEILMTDPSHDIAAFAGARLIATGALASVALAAKAVLDGGETAPVLLFDATARPVELDFRGSPEDVAARLRPAVGEPETPRGPGRPKLGVVAREVTLLPRHWDWLAAQPGGASVALRKLVEAARRTGEAKDRVRQAQEITYRFMTAMAGNEAEFDEAIRALFAADKARFEALTGIWPKDLADHIARLAAPVFEAAASASE